MKSTRITATVGEVTEFSDEEFNKLWNINPAGDVEGAYIAAAFSIRTKVFLDGSKITIEELTKRYQEYVTDMMQRGSYKFIVRLSNWISQERYNHQHGKPVNPKKTRYI